MVSASAEAWIAPWCKKQNLALIATRLETKNGKLTGRIFSSNNNYEEKVNRIKAEYKLEDYETTYAYGDSKGDKAMLAIMQGWA